MSDQTASFKVTLHRKGSSEAEIRRFILPRSALSSYSILRDKLQVVFQSIKNIPFEVTWEDGDGDRVLISSDEELMIAMQEMIGDVHRLRIDIADPEPADLNGDEIGGPLHASVWCDVCSEEIKGFRYKCIQCSNYDLCGQCERIQSHKEHFMIRIPEPIVWRPEFGHRLMHQMSKSAKRHRSASHCGEGRGRGNAYHHRPCHSHDYGAEGQRYHFPGLFHQMFQNFWDPSSVRPQPEQQQEEAAAPTPSTSAEKKTGEQEDGHVTYLKSIGETVAYLLDPLGIDVNIEVETKKDKDAKSKAKEESSNAEKTSKDAEKKSDDGKKKSKDDGKKSKDDKKKSKDDEKKSKDDEKTAENTLVNAACSTEAEAKASASEEKQPKSTGSSKSSEADGDADQWDVINADALIDSIEVVIKDKSPKGAESKPTNPNSGSSPVKVNSGVTEPTPAIGPRYPNLRDELSYPYAMHNLPMPPNPQMFQYNPCPTAPSPRRTALPIIDPYTGVAVNNIVAPPAVPPIPVPIPSPIPHPIPPPVSHPITPSHPGQVTGNMLHPHHPPRSVFQQVNHPRPVINQALAQMTSMGFNNEGGWLTTLLEAVNGDVGKALDILSPVKK
ncbi:sequestosome-1 isoform X2 [Ischnura elegans]|nr:sequestosome-1 isoform X2 [Ischnura elegans]